MVHARAMHRPYKTLKRLAQASSWGRKAAQCGLPPVENPYLLGGLRAAWSKSYRQHANAPAEKLER